jgi:hypothetical protein
MSLNDNSMKKYPSLFPAACPTYDSDALNNDGDAAAVLGAASKTFVVCCFKRKFFDRDRMNTSVVVVSGEAGGQFEQAPRIQSSLCYRRNIV